MTKDVIGFRVSEEVKKAWDNLNDADKDRVRAFLEQLIMLYSAGFSVEMAKREFDSLRAEICPDLLRAFEYMNKSSCIYKCYDSNVSSLFNHAMYLVQKLCKTHPVRTQGVKVDRGVANPPSFNT
jgi:hypothetical protein